MSVNNFNIRLSGILKRADAQYGFKKISETLVPPRFPKASPDVLQELNGTQIDFNQAAINLPHKTKIDKSLIIESQGDISNTQHGKIFSSGDIKVRHDLNNPFYFVKSWSSWGRNYFARQDEVSNRINNGKFYPPIESENQALFRQDKLTSNHMTYAVKDKENIILVASIGSGGLLCNQHNHIVGTHEKKSDDKWYVGCGKAGDIYKEYLDILSSHFDKKPSRRQKSQQLAEKVMPYYSTWHEYLRNIDAPLIEFVLNKIDKKIPIKTLQIDDGWQNNLGDWQANAKFPSTDKDISGMKVIADTIKQRDLHAGIWIAPFMAESGSEIAQHHPEYFVKDTKGNPLRLQSNWSKFNTKSPYIYAFDMTHPEAKQYIQKTMKRITKDWGYDFLKLDFLYAGGVQGQRFDNEKSREQALRDGLDCIRQAVGDDVFIEAVGIPQQVTIGIADAVRGSIDRIKQEKPQEAYSYPHRAMTVPSGQNAFQNLIPILALNPAIRTHTDAGFFSDNSFLKDEFNLIANLMESKGIGEGIRKAVSQKDEINQWLEKKQSIHHISQQKFKKILDKAKIPQNNDVRETLKNILENNLK